MIDEKDITSAAMLAPISNDPTNFLKGITTPSERAEMLKRLQIVSLLRQGMSQHKIAETLGVGVATVSRGHREQMSGAFDDFFNCLPQEYSQTFNFGESDIPRIFKGSWQLSGGHGEITRQQAISDMIAYAEEGVYVFDTGDIYGDSEAIIGDFLKQYRQTSGSEKADRVRVHTKFVPDLNALDDLTFEDVEKTIHRSRERLGVEMLDLVQFHWWDFSKGDFVQAALWLQSLQKQGYIRQIGLTNFDCTHTQSLIDAGIQIASNQIQFSLFDPRPLNGMLKMAQENNFAIFCYGVLAGGLIEAPMNDTNRSHIKYKIILEEVGDAYYRKITSLLKELSKKYKTSSSNIALTYILQTQGVSSVIIGPKNTSHLNELSELSAIDTEDFLKLRRLHTYKQQLIDDDIYSYERQLEGRHGKIMKYNQNRMRTDA